MNPRSSANENRGSVIRLPNTLRDTSDILPRTVKQKARNMKSRFDENVSNSDAISDRLSPSRSYMARDWFHIRTAWFADRRFAKNWQRELNDQLIKNLTERNISSVQIEGSIGSNLIFFKINKPNATIPVISSSINSRTRRAVRVKFPFVAQIEPSIFAETSSMLKLRFSSELQA